jgi:hypothetical protein
MNEFSELASQVLYSRRKAPPVITARGGKRPLIVVDWERAAKALKRGLRKDPSAQK